MTSKRDIVLHLLESQEWVTTDEFLRAGCGSRFGARIQELREAGYDIPPAERVRDGQSRYRLRRSAISGGPGNSTADVTGVPQGRAAEEFSGPGSGGSNRPAAAISRPPINEESRVRFESAIKWRIRDALVMEGEFRVESLDEMRIPDEYRFLVREAINRAKSRGYMEGGQGLYEVTKLGRKELTKIVRDTSTPVEPEEAHEGAQTLPLDLPEVGPDHHYREAA